jgi:hypothetical protein
VSACVVELVGRRHSRVPYCLSQLGQFSIFNLLEMKMNFPYHVAILPFYLLVFLLLSIFNVDACMYGREDIVAVYSFCFLFLSSVDACKFFLLTLIFPLPFYLTFAPFFPGWAQRLCTLYSILRTLSI